MDIDEIMPFRYRWCFADPSEADFLFATANEFAEIPVKRNLLKGHRCRDEPLLREQDTRNDAVQMAALTSSLAMMLPEKHVVPGYAKNSPEFMLFRAVKQMDNEAKKLSQPHRSTDSRNRSA